MTRTRLRTSTIWIRGALTIATSTNVIVAFLAATAVNASPTFLALTPGPVVFLSVIVMVAGILVYAITNRVTERPDLWFAVIASAVALLSLAAPVLLALDPARAPARLGEASPSAALALIPLHLIPAAALVLALRWRGRPESDVELETA